MDSKQIWTIIGISLVVAIVASIATLGLTGNVIRVPYSATGTDVYTKADMDLRLNALLNVMKSQMDQKIKTAAQVGDIATNQGILNMLGTCTDAEPVASCKATCEMKGLKTIGSSSSIVYTALKQDGQRDFEWINLFDWGGNSQPMPSCGNIGSEGTTISNVNPCKLTENVEELMEMETGFNATTTAISNVGVRSRCICCSPYTLSNNGILIYDGTSKTLKLNAVFNSPSGGSSDVVQFLDVATGKYYNAETESKGVAWFFYKDHMRYVPIRYYDGYIIFNYGGLAGPIPADQKVSPGGYVDIGGLIV